MCLGNSHAMRKVESETVWILLRYADTHFDAEALP